MKKIALENSNFSLQTEIPDIIERNEVKEDTYCNAMFTELANGLVTEFGLLCGEPFIVEIAEYECGDDESHAFARIATVDPEGKDVVQGGKNKPVFSVSSMQYYAARNTNNIEESYMGKVIVRASMYYAKTGEPSLSDSDSRSGWGVNRLIYPLLRLAMAHYYAVIVKYFSEWDTDYRNAPVILREPW